MTRCTRPACAPPASRPARPGFVCAFGVPAAPPVPARRWRDALCLLPSSSGPGALRAWGRGRSAERPWASSSVPARSVCRPCVDSPRSQCNTQRASARAHVSRQMCSSTHQCYTSAALALTRPSPRALATGRIRSASFCRPLPGLFVTTADSDSLELEFRRLVREIVSVAGRCGRRARGDAMLGWRRTWTSRWDRLPKLQSML